MSKLDEIAVRLDNAAINATAVQQLSDAISLEDAYEIQRRSIGLRLQRGERKLGFKMGLTSRAKMLQVGVSEMNWGRLTRAMMVDEGGILVMSRYIHPRAEPEVAFMIGRRLEGNVSMMEASSAIDGIAGAIEILDSRYKDFKFSITDVIADNSSSSAVVLGPWRTPDTDISNLGIVLSVNGIAREIGSSAAILGHPLRALVAGARLLSLRGECLEPGDILLAGAATAAVPINSGDHVLVETETLGRCDFNVQ